MISRLLAVQFPGLELFDGFSEFLPHQIMEERSELGKSFPRSSGHHCEDVADKTIFIKSMLRTITEDEQCTGDKASRRSANVHDDHSINSNSIESYFTNQNPAISQPDNDGMHTKPAPIEPFEKKTPVNKPLTKEPQRVVKKILITNPDLKAAHRIVMQIMSDRGNYAFMDEVDVKALNLWDYHDRIKEPMWLTKIEDKFNNEEYSNITQVIRDLRLMLENCYRYNGLDHYVSKQAMKIEQVLETKLSLLPRLLQVQTTLYVTSDGKYGEPPVTATTSLTGRRRAGGRLHSGGATTPLSNCIQSEILLAQAEEKKRQQQQRQEELLQYRKELDEWERDLLQQPNQDHLNAMWEIPAIGQFLLLFQETLALNEISYYELERCFLMPRQSKLLAQVFTCLLSSPTQRKREISKNMGMAMPYKVWQRKLKEKVQKWYQVVDSWQDTQWAASDLGIDVHFFEVMGDKFPLNDYQYHELTYYQRVMLMKAVCDNCLEIQFPLRQCLDLQPIMDQRAIILGEDSNGNTYVHFPQFCGYDLRIYKQAPFPEPELRYIEVDEPDEAVKMDSESEECSNGKRNKNKDKYVELTPEPRKRPSNLRQKLTPSINSFVYGERRCTRTSKSSQELTTASGQSTVSSSNHLNNVSNSKSQSDNLKNKENIEQEKCVKMGCKLEASDLSTREGSTDIPAYQVTTKSYINKEDKNHNNSNSVQPSGCLTQDLKYDDKLGLRKMMENQKLNGQFDIKTENPVSNTNLKEPKTLANESTCDSSNFDMDVKEENSVKDSDVIGKEHEKEGTINTGSKMVEKMRDVEVKSIENEEEENGLNDILSNSKEEHVKPKLILPEVEPDRAAFTLVCDSIDSLKSLVEEFAEREPVEVTKGRRKKITKPPARTESEVELHETLTRLLMELAPHESKLCNAVVRVKERLRKEFNNFQESQDESDSWESESSSGSSSTSDSDSSESDDEGEENKNEEEVKSKEEEQEEELVDEEEVMETIEPFLGISTRAQKISKKRKLIEAKKKAKLGGNEDHTEAKKKCLSPVNTNTYNPEIPILDSFPVGNLAARQPSLTPVNMDNIYQTLQQQIAAACNQAQGNHSINSTKSIPEPQSEKNLVKTKLAAPPACTIVVDDAVWKEIQNDPHRQKEVVLKYLLQQRQKLSGQRDQKLQTTLSSQEINHGTIGDANRLPSVTTPIPKSGLLSIQPEAFGVSPVSKQPTFGQDLQTMSREPQGKGEGAQKEILISKLSAIRNIPTLCSTSSSPSVSINLNIPHSTSSQVTPAERTYTPSKDKLQLTDAQIKENKVNEAKKQKENMLAQQWLQQLILLQQSTSKAPTLSTPLVQFSQSNVRATTKVSTVANMKSPSEVKTSVRPILSSQLISQAAKLLQKKPNSNSTGYEELVKKVQQLPNESKGTVFIPNAIGTSIPSTGVKTIGDGNLLKIQNHATSTSNTKKANQEVVVSLEYLQKLQQQSKLKQSNATLINRQVNANPQNTAQRNLIILKTSGSPDSGDATSSTKNAVTFTKGQSSISPNATKLPTTVANTKVVHQQIVATDQGKVCLVKMADGTLRALNLVQQKAPVKKNILTSSLLSNQSTPLSLNSSTSQAAISKPQLNGSTLGSTLMTQKQPAVNNDPSNLSSVKTASSVVLPSPSPVHATKATTVSRNTTSQSVQNTTANIILSGEEYKTYMHLGVLPSRYNKQNQSLNTECSVSHQSLEKQNKILNTSGNVDSTSTLKGNYQDICGSSTSISGCANIVLNELLVRNKATNEGSLNKFNQE